MFELIKPGTKIDFLRYQTAAIALSLVVIAIGLLSVTSRGMNYGIDFAGGTLVEIRPTSKLAIEDVRSVVSSVSTGDASVQESGSGEYIVRVPQTDTEASKELPTKVLEGFNQRFGDGSVELRRVETVGPRVGRELSRRAILAVVAATILMGVYVSIRFEPRFGIGAGVALFHDVLVTVGALSLAGYEFDLNVVAALLTIVGFSVNDTVVISDRVREKMHGHGREPLRNLLNASINETLSRTILTTGTALLSVLSLYLFGGDILRGFAFSLLVGFVAGSYSTIFIVAPIVLAVEGRSAPRA
jgi:preprotein translocase subunit SecF